MEVERESGIKEERERKRQGWCADGRLACTPTLRSKCKK